MATPSTAAAAIAARERSMIADPLSWPCWPILPMKRRDGAHASPAGLGFLCDLGHPHTVYIGLMPMPSELAKLLDPSFDWGDFLNPRARRVFANLGEMLAVYMID